MLRTLFILAILGPGTYAAVRNRYAALLMYLWFALFRPQDWLWVDITSLRLSLVFGVILVVPAVMAAIYPNVKHPLSVGMILFFVACVLAQVNAVSPAVGWSWIDFVFRLLVACMMLTTLASDEKRLLGVIAVISASLGVHAAKAGLAYAVGGGTRFADGLAGAFVDNNGYALGTVMIIPLLLATAQNVDLVYKGRLLPWIRAGFYAAVPLCILAMIGTYSRGGVLAFTAAVLAFVMVQRRRGMTLAALGVTVTIFLLVVPIPQSYLDRVQTIQTYKEIGDDSALSRPHFWKVGTLMAADHPLGIGLRQYELTYDKYDFLHGRFGHSRAVHSSHIQVLAETGFFGALAWTGLFAYALVVCLRVRARSQDERLPPTSRRFLFTVANALLTSMVAFIVGGAFLSLALNDITWLTFAMVASLDLVSRRMCEQSSAVQQRAVVPPPMAFRAVSSFATASRGPV